jgi:hypothetical protein
MRDYQIILPDGVYTSGVYSIPNGKTWNDFKFLLAIMGRAADKMAGAWIPSEAFANESWQKNISPDDDRTSVSKIQRFSSTQFWITSSGNGAVRMLAGYLA